MGHVVFKCDYSWRPLRAYLKGRHPTLTSVLVRLGSKILEVQPGVSDRHISRAVSNMLTNVLLTI